MLEPKSRQQGAARKPNKLTGAAHNTTTEHPNPNNNNISAIGYSREVADEMVEVEEEEEEGGEFMNRFLVKRGDAFGIKSARQPMANRNHKSTSQMLKAAARKQQISLIHGMHSFKSSTTLTANPLYRQLTTQCQCSHCCLVETFVQMDAKLRLDRKMARQLAKSQQQQQQQPSHKPSTAINTATQT